MASAESLGWERSPRRLATRLRWIEIVVLLGLGACGLWLFFGRMIESRFSLYPGDLADWRFCGVVLEHWYSVLTGYAEWRSPVHFYPIKNTLGYGDALFLFVPFYAPFRMMGIDPSLSFVLCFMSVMSFGFVSCYWVFSRALMFPKLLAFALSYAFVFSNMAAIRYPHATLYTFSFLPTLLALTIRFLSLLLTRRSAVTAGIAVSVMLAAVIYTGFYIGYFFILFSIFFLIIFFIVNSLFDWSSTKVIVRRLWSSRTVLVQCAVSFGLAVVPFLLTYLPALQSVGPRDWDMVACMLPLPRDFLNVSGNAFWDWMVRRFPAETRPCGWELIFGVTPWTLLLFALSSVWLAWMTCHGHGAPHEAPTKSGNDVLSGNYILSSAEFQLRVAFALVLTVLFCWIVMLRLDIGSLWYLVYRFIPGASALRAIFRFQLLLNFIILIVIGFSLPRIVRTWPRALGLFFIAVAGGGIALEQYNVNHPFFEGKYQAEQLALIPTPPSACRQFFVDSDGLEKSEGYMGNLGATIVAQRVGIPTLNGYSGSTPPGFRHSETTDPSYIPYVASWAIDHHLLNGLCILNLTRKSWQELPARLSDIRRSLTGSDLVRFRSDDPMWVFALQRTGLHAPELGGAWTTGNATFMFSAPVTGKKIVVSGHRGYMNQNVSVIAAGQRIVVDPSGANFQVELPVSEPVSSIEIIVDSFIPAARGMGPDVRRLGAYLNSVIVEN